MLTHVTVTIGNEASWVISQLDGNLDFFAGARCSDGHLRLGPLLLKSWFGLTGRSGESKNVQNRRSFT